MNQRIILSAISLFFAFQAQAQTNDTLKKQESILLNDLKQDKKEIAEKKAEMRNNKQDVSATKKEISQLKKKRSYDKQEIRKLEAEEVGTTTKEEFFKDFPKAQVIRWERTDDFIQVTFNKEGKPKTAYYDNTNKLVGTTIEKSYTDLPGKAQTYISNNYSGYKTILVLFYEDNVQNEMNMNLYNQYFEDADYYFVEMTKNNATTVLKVDLRGNVSLFK